MSISMFGHSAESLQKRKMEKFDKDLRTKSKLSNLRMDELEDYTNENNDIGNLQEIKPKDGEAHLLVNAKLFTATSKQLEDLIINLNYLEQDYKNKIQQKLKHIILEAANLVEQRIEFERNLVTELKIC